MVTADRAVGRRGASATSDDSPPHPLGEEVTLRVSGGAILGDLAVPSGAIGTVLFAHGSGSGRKSARNRQVARALEEAGIATLLLDLLTSEEAAIDEDTRRYRFDIPRLSDRVIAGIDALSAWPGTAGRPVGLYGASTGGAAALIAAAARPTPVRAAVLRGARSDLAGPAVGRVRAPTLFLVGEFDPEIRRLNEDTRSEMPAESELIVVPGATHLFEEPGALEAVALHATAWYRRYLAASSPGRT